MRQTNSAAPSLDAEVESVCEQAATPYAYEVDRQARFPHEAIDALRQARLLAAAVPVELGGRGLDLASLTRVAGRLAQSCGATAMIWAMNQIQYLCIVRHIQDERSVLDDLLKEATDAQWLIASATSEIGTGGDIGRSLAALERLERRVVLEKAVPVLSYGQQADAFLVTARSSPESAPTEQSLVLATAQQTSAEVVGAWDTMGMRGTCSPPFRITIDCSEGQVFRQPFHEVNQTTMAPSAHILWAAVWIGLAESAVRTAARATRKRSPATGSGRRWLAEADQQVRAMAGNLTTVVAEVDEIWRQHSELSPKQQLDVNSLKVNTSEGAALACMQAMRAVGMAAYSEQGEQSLSRSFRDVMSASVMVNNDRILAVNEELVKLVR